MPELPEVETIRRIVERDLLGKIVADAALTLPKLLRASPIDSLQPLTGCQVVGARRRAKVLMIDFSSDLSLMIHFKLAGQLAVFGPDGRRGVAGHPVPDPAGPYPHKATHLTVTFTDGTQLYYSDVRQFGWLRLMPTEVTAAAILTFAYGPEAIGDERITLEQLRDRLSRRTVAVKQALLDQTVVAGLGNIYVDEALHASKIHPQRPAYALSEAELARLYAAIAWALERGIEQGGAKIVHNRAYPIDGFPQVHARAGEPCQDCGTTIVKIRVGTRGTYLCPACQPESDGAKERSSRQL